MWSLPILMLFVTGPFQTHLQKVNKGLEKLRIRKKNVTMIIMMSVTVIIMQNILSILRKK